jgi:hypothetical protein
VCLAQLSGDDTILCDLSYFILCDLLEPHGARGDICAGNLSTTCGGRGGGFVRETIAKHDILL